MPGVGDAGDLAGYIGRARCHLVDIGTDASFEVVLAYSVPAWCGDMVEAYADELDLLLPAGALVSIERPAIAEGAGFGRLHQMAGGSDTSAYGVDPVVLGEDTAA